MLMLYILTFDEFVGFILHLYSMISIAISTASKSNQVALRQEADTGRQSSMKCFKKWGFPIPISSLDSQKKPPTTSMVSSMPKKPWLWKRPKACLGKTGAVPGARAAKVLEKHGNWVGFEGNFAGKLCFCMVLPWFLPFKMIEHVGFLEKNAQKSLCPKERKWNRWHSIAMLDYRRVGYIEWRCPAAMVSHRGKTCHINITRARGLSLIISKWEQIQSSKQEMELGLAHHSSCVCKCIYAEA